MDRLCRTHGDGADRQATMTGALPTDEEVAPGRGRREGDHGIGRKVFRAVATTVDAGGRAGDLAVAFDGDRQGIRISHGQGDRPAIAGVGGVRVIDPVMIQTQHEGAAVGMAIEVLASLQDAIVDQGELRAIGQHLVVDEGEL